MLVHLALARLGTSDAAAARSFATASRCALVEADVFNRRSDQHRAVRPRHEVAVGSPDHALIAPGSACS
jgi:hypothetical protein